MLGDKEKKKKVERDKEIEISGVRAEERDERTRSVHGWGLRWVRFGMFFNSFQLF